MVKEGQNGQKKRPKRRQNKLTKKCQGAKKYPKKAKMAQMQKEMTEYYQNWQSSQTRSNMVQNGQKMVEIGKKVTKKYKKWPKMTKLAKKSGKNLQTRPKKKMERIWQEKKVEHQWKNPHRPRLVWPCIALYWPTFGLQSCIALHRQRCLQKSFVRVFEHLPQGKTNFLNWIYWDTKYIVRAYYHYYSH